MKLSKIIIMIEALTKREVVSIRFNEAKTKIYYRLDGQIEETELDMN